MKYVRRDHPLDGHIAQSGHFAPEVNLYHVGKERFSLWV